jgi:type IV pilus assembly protein PilC
MKNVINGLVEQLEQGVSFSQAILEYPGVFPHSFWQVIQSSEKTGELGKGLLQIADYLENRAIIADRIRRALAYPIFVIGLGIAVMIMMITTVLPPILRLFESFNTELPPVTAFAIGAINFFTGYKMHLLLVLVLLIGMIYLYSRLPGGRLSIDRFLLKLPILGTITAQHALGLFCRTASMLFKAGLPLPNIMDVAIQSTTKNKVVLKSLTNLKDRLMQGEGLARPMAEDSFFPPMMVRMITVGEQTGTLESALETLARYYEEHSNKRIHALIGMIEPALTLAIGLGIAFIMYSMIIPIYTIMRSMS